MIPRFSAPVFGSFKQAHLTLVSKAFPSPPGSKADRGGWLVPAALTQPLEVLHRPLVALQRRVGLGGLIQEHLQSWEHHKNVILF